MAPTTSRMSVLQARLIEIQERETERLLTEVMGKAGDVTANAIRGIILRHSKAEQAAKDELTAGQRLIEDLTPGGSEFAHDIPACVAYLKERMNTIPTLRRQVATLNQALLALD